MTSSWILNDILKLDQEQWLPNRLDVSPILWPWYRDWPLPNCERFPESFFNGYGMLAGNAYPSGHLFCPFWTPVLSLLGTCICSSCRDNFSRTCRDFPDFSPRIFLGTFSILIEKEIIQLGVFVSFLTFVIYDRELTLALTDCENVQLVIELFNLYMEDEKEERVGYILDYW